MLPLMLCAFGVTRQLLLLLSGRRRRRLPKKKKRRVVVVAGTKQQQGHEGAVCLEGVGSDKAFVDFGEGGVGVIQRRDAASDGVLLLLGLCVYRASRTLRATAVEAEGNGAPSKSLGTASVALQRTVAMIAVVSACRASLRAQRCCWDMRWRKLVRL
jgi:hypothetical protein